MKLTDLRGILEYVPRFREKIFVIAVDGAIVTDENFGNLLLDVALLRSLNIRVVLVHGAAAQIRELAEEQKITPSNADGTGITDAPTLQLALTAANRLTHEILEGLSANDLRAACTNAVIAHPMGIIQGVDHLYTGKVERVDVDLLQTLLSQGVIPVVPPLGFDGDGKTVPAQLRSCGRRARRRLEGHQADFSDHRKTVCSNEISSGRCSPVIWTKLRNQSGPASIPRSFPKRSMRWMRASNTLCRACISSMAALRKGCWRKCSPTRASGR